MKHPRAFLSVLTMIVVAVVVYMGRKPSQKSDKDSLAAIAQIPIPTMNNENKIVEKQEKRPERSVSSITQNEVSELRKTFPDKNDVKSEVAENPHRTPPSLINFANKMGPLMEKALQNNSDADVLIDELKNCALDDKVAQPARALCVSDADRIAKAHPEMKKKAGDIRSNVSSDVIQLLNKKNLLLKKTL